VADPLRDPRLPRLLAAARNYRPCTAMAVWDTDERWRLVFEDGEPGYYRTPPGSPDQETQHGFDAAALTALAVNGMLLADLFPAVSQVA
jgi:hypothetical protein